MKKLLGFLMLVCLFIQNTPNAIAKNMYVMEANSKGFSIVRTGKPSRKDFRELCKNGVRKMIVMSGNGSIERKYAASECPGFEVIYDKKQSSLVPMSIEFLNFFDQELQKAIDGNYGIAFRCNCGCHRTGRLAAYIKMKRHGISAKEALKDQKIHAPGIARLLYPKTLKNQIKALEDYINERPCSVSSKYCLSEYEREIRPEEYDMDEEDANLGEE